LSAYPETETPTLWTWKIKADKFWEREKNRSRSVLFLNVPPCREKGFLGDGSLYSHMHRH